MHPCFAFVLSFAVVAACASRDDSPAPSLNVTWAGSEGQPGCVYHADERLVEATLAITGHAPKPQSVTVTVTAYSDENTSEPVGSTSRTVEVEGTFDQTLVVSMPVNEAPHVDIDGVAACSRTVNH